MGTIWYLWAIHNHPATNEYLAKVIGEGNEEYAYKDKLCADGVRRDLFRCPNGYSDVKKAVAALAAFNLRLEVLKVEGDSAPTLFELWKKSVKKKAMASMRKKMLHQRSALMPRCHSAKKP